MAEHDSSIDDYMASFPGPVQAHLSEIRSIVRAVAPDVEETISYRIPAFKLDGKMLVYMAGWRDHVSMYPIPAGDDGFETELTEYKHGKGTVHFALDEKLPVDFIRKFVGLHVGRIR